MVHGYDGDQDHMFAVHVGSERKEGFHHIDIVEKPRDDGNIKVAHIFATSELADELHDREGGKVTIEVVRRNEDILSPIEEIVVVGEVTDVEGYEDGAAFEVTPQSMTVDGRSVL